MRSVRRQGVVIRLTTPTTSELRADQHYLDMVVTKVNTDGLWQPTRSDIREVGRIRIKYGLAKQRDDETYIDYLHRLSNHLKEEFLKTVKE